LESRRLAAALALVAVGAVIAVIYPYSLFYASPSTQWLVVKATLALIGLLAGAFVSSVGIAVLAAMKVRKVEAEAPGEGEEGR